MAASPDGSKVCVTNDSSIPGTVSVIATASSMVIATIPVGTTPTSFGIFIATPVVRSAPLSGSLCNGVYDGLFAGNITVSAGQDCAFINGGQVTGNVTLVSGNFVLTGATIGGNVTAKGGGTFTLGPAATVGGNLTIVDLPPGSASNSVCGTTVLGNMTFDNNATAVQIGSADALVCAGNKIAGTVIVNSNTNSVLIFDNAAGGNATVNNNTGSLDVVGNNVSNNLQCLNNSMLIMGGGNAARLKTEQCN